MDKESRGEINFSGKQSRGSLVLNRDSAYRREMSARVPLCPPHSSRNTHTWLRLSHVLLLLKDPQDKVGLSHTPHFSHTHRPSNYIPLCDRGNDYEDSISLPTTQQGLALQLEGKYSMVWRTKAFGFHRPPMDIFLINTQRCCLTVTG